MFSKVGQIDVRSKLSTNIHSENSSKIFQSASLKSLVSEASVQVSSPKDQTSKIYLFWRESKFFLKAS